MVKAQSVIRCSLKYLGIPYSTLDCQKFVEKALADAGIKKDLAGSNAWFREVMKNGWIGSPEECKKQFGTIPRGAFLFILTQDGREPEKYHDDGIGNASHIGIYTGMTGSKMCEMSGVPDADRYNFGDGAIHSSSSRGCVCTSRFFGKTINGGWNRIGIWNQIDYSGGDETVFVTYFAKVVGGGALNLRTEPNKDSERLCQMPEGSIVTVTDELSGWSQVKYYDMEGYAMSKYLEEIKEGGNQDEETDFVKVPKAELEKVFGIIASWIRG